jgi:SRSO17 transposase
MPSLDPAAMDRLAEYAASFADDFPQAKPAAWAGVYLQGLLLNGGRKSVEPLARRVRLPTGLTSKDPEQALQQFVNQSPWDEQKVLRRYRARLAGTFANYKAVYLISDLAFPKQGRHSVGVDRQFCGSVGEKANCQVAVAVHYTAAGGNFPLDLRLALPQAWLIDRSRLDKAGVPEPERWPFTKPQIALSLLDRARADGLPGRAVVADAEYGAASDFRSALDERCLRYVLGVPSDFVVFRDQPAWAAPRAAAGGRSPAGYQLAVGNPPPVPVAEVAARLPRRKVTWRAGESAARFAWTRVWPGQGWQRGACARARSVWLLVEERADESLEYAVSNLPEHATDEQALRLWKRRRRVERVARPLMEELGMGHFAGRSWRGFHHHAAMVFLAYGFLLLEKHLAR